MRNATQKLNNLQLYYFPTCMHCAKVQVALWWLGIEIPKKNILFNSKFKNELISGGGKKQVPCLRIESEDGHITWLYESSDIIKHLKETIR